MYFFSKDDSANKDLGTQAVDLLLSSRHLHAMSCLPALCNICCICLKHLLLESEEEKTKVQIREAEGCETQRQPTENEPKGRRDGSEDITTDRINDRALIPPTLTQVYLTFLDAFLSHEPPDRGRSDKTKNTPSAQRYTTIRSLNILIMYYYVFLSNICICCWLHLKYVFCLIVQHGMSAESLSI